MTLRCGNFLSSTLQSCWAIEIMIIKASLTAIYEHYLSSTVPVLCLLHGDRTDQCINFPNDKQGSCPSKVSYSLNETGTVFLYSQPDGLILKTNFLSLNSASRENPSTQLLLPYSRNLLQVVSHLVGRYR
ncbi:hypothetical protein CC80DRAFT_23913 [Byssothecium circinans]|uniref:Uncharacterized protein n=1 Tax=Byssothecium circinans TaxID=147558 RepID=A0A6A5U4U1_9PLEO|nr:hypothetical protein CC80DRAFT_23913 [Byssothecium circinans]